MRLLFAENLKEGLPKIYSYHRERSEKSVLKPHYRIYTDSSLHAE